jgi:hypothetical protein
MSSERAEKVGSLVRRLLPVNFYRRSRARQDLHNMGQWSAVIPPSVEALVG